MNIASFVFQLLNGLASASSLFLVASGLSLIFGVTRVVNFAHGSLFMLGIYLAYSLVAQFSFAYGYWLGLLIAAALVGAVGALLEFVLMRRVYRSPELFQLLATFAVVLILKDAVLWLWGAEELLGPRAPGFKSSLTLLGRQFPEYDLLLIALGPIVLLALWLLLTRTRWGTLIRAATQDREMVAALGVNQRWLFTSVFFLGAFLAGLGGALQLPREPASLELDLTTITAAFVVVVVGGMGSIPGAYLAALLIAESKAICIWLGTIEVLGFTISFSKMTLVIEFLIMAIILLVRPWGLLGRPMSSTRSFSVVGRPIKPLTPRMRLLATLMLGALFALVLVLPARSYALVLGIDILIAALFAVSLHLLLGPAGLQSFGHAVYFGLGAYGGALFVRHLHLPMELALVLAPLVASCAAIVLGWFSVRLSGVYLAMLTLAFAQIVWAIVFQWDDFTGGSNGLTDLWPAPWLSSTLAYYVLTLLVVSLSILSVRRLIFSPFGLSLRAARDSAARADAIGLHVNGIHWRAFVMAGAYAGVAGALFVFSKGSISPDVLAVGRSVDGLVMVLLGGVDTLIGPVVGAISLTWMQDLVARNTDYWRAMLGALILLLVMAFPQGIAGYLPRFFQSRGKTSLPSE